MKISTHRLWGDLLKDRMDHVIKLPSKEHLSICTDNDMGYINHTDLHQIQILSRVLNNIMDLKLNIEGATGLQLTVASAPPIGNTTKEYLLEYKLMYIIHKTHSLF